jgi:hypothetical protein
MMKQKLNEKLNKRPLGRLLSDHVFQVYLPPRLLLFFERSRFQQGTRERLSRLGTRDVVVRADGFHMAAVSWSGPARSPS